MMTEIFKPPTKKLESFLDHLYAMDYKEKPVSVDEFICSTRFLGNLTDKGKSAYKIWRDTLGEVMAEDSRYLVVFTGAIGCLGPDVSVSLLDGRELTIPQIIEERKQGIQHWVYSYDIENKTMVPGKVTDAMISGISDNIVRVVLDNDTTIDCTHNHPFLLTNGKYIQAEQLQPGDSLEPLYRTTKKGYEKIATSKKQWYFTQHLVIRGNDTSLEAGECVHHRDFNKKNNNPENLRKMSSKAHFRYHSYFGNPFKRREGFAKQCAKKSSAVRWYGEGNEEQRKQASLRLKEMNKDGQALRASLMSKFDPDSIIKKKKYIQENIEKIRKNAEKGNKARWENKNARNHQAEKMKTWHAKKGHDIETCRCCMCRAKRGETTGINNSTYGKILSTRKTRITKNCLFCDDVFQVMLGGFNEKQKYCSRACNNRHRAFLKKNIERNHKVKKVERIPGKLDVYDLTIEKYHNFALTNGVFVHNTGKTRSAIWGMSYVLYRVLCLKNPWQFFGKASGGKMAVVFFNLTRSLGDSKGFGLLQSHLLSSPWFLSKGMQRGKSENAWLDIPLYSYRLASPYSKGFGTQGEDVITAIMDEVDSPTESDKQRVRVLNAYEQTVRRFESRFVDDVYGESIGKFFLVASKQDEMSFLNTFVDEMKNAKNVFIKDVAYWETLPKEELSPRKFSVMVGDVYLPSKILSTKEEIKQAQNNGYQVIQVPMNFYDAFSRDISGALKDIAGISVIGLRRSKLFSSEAFVKKCMDPSIPCPLSKKYIEIGLEDDINLIDFLDLSKLQIPRHVGRHIHCDIAYSGDGDAMSLSMACPAGFTKTNIQKEDGTFEERTVAIVQTDFTMRLKAPPGDQIPIHKMRKFVLDMHSRGVIIEKFTSDLALLSTDTMQILSQRGIKCESLSLDKTIAPYTAFKDLVTENRWICYQDPILYLELINLQYDKQKNKIDHPDKIKDLMISKEGDTKEIIVKGSKDMSDAAAGAVYSVLLATGSLPANGEFVKAILSTLGKEEDVKDDFLEGYWWLSKDSIGNVQEDKEEGKKTINETSLTTASGQLQVLEALKSRW